jgi:hypothetical protein
MGRLIPLLQPYQPNKDYPSLPSLWVWLGRLGIVTTTNHILFITKSGRRFEIDEQPHYFIGRILPSGRSLVGKNHLVKKLKMQATEFIGYEGGRPIV